MIVKQFRHLTNVTFEMLAGLVLHVRKEGGATFNLILDEHATPERYGRYRLSNYKFAERSVPFEEFHIEALVEYIEEFEHHFMSYELGIWHNPDDGQVYFDISEGEDELESAMISAKVARQLAIYDTVTGQTINVPQDEEG